MQLPNGQKFDLLSLALLGNLQYPEKFHVLMNKLIEFKFDLSDYVCVKFMLLLNPGNYNEFLKVFYYSKIYSVMQQ